VERHLRLLARMLNTAGVIIPAMTISELGEFGLINLIRSAVKYEGPVRSPWQEILADIGDDAAAWRSDDHIVLATTDTLVQDVHFDLNIVTWRELGWKALAVNLSDIAAMGGIPKYALLSLALPGELEADSICEFAEGLMRLARNFNVAMVGGNIAAAPSVVITLTIIGCSRGEAMLRRSAARPGDQIAVTGCLGLSAAGLQMLKGSPVSDPEMANILRNAHFQPMPRLEEGGILIERGVKAAIDISDGLVADLDHICKASGVSARISIEGVPVHPVVKANFENHQELALSGGEDYELLFTADKAVVARVQQALSCPVTVIGDIVEEQPPTRVRVVDSRGNTIPYAAGGWEHFRHGIAEARFP
jgi:thiamine-monophosphate kinase